MNHSAKPMTASKVDVVIPTKNKANKNLLKALKNMTGVGKIIIATDSPLSLARKRAVLSAETDWVAMVDDDVVLPKNWLHLMLCEVGLGVGVVASVAQQGNKHVAAYDRVVGFVVGLHKVNTSPHINNMIIRRSLMEDYNPPPLFFGEDHHLKRYVESSGYKWKVIPPIGAIHLGNTKNHTKLGEAYRRYGHYSAFQMIRRVIARFIFTPYAAATNMSLKTVHFLNRLNVEFIAGWLKEYLREKL